MQQTNIMPHSLSAVFGNVLMLSVLNFASAAPAANISHNYRVNSNSATYNGLFNNQVAETVSAVDFEKVISDFYTQLLAEQEPIDEEFEKLLHENRWDLYEV